MHVELLREFCLAKIAVEECFPFDENTLVFKVAGKMFCLIGLENPNQCNLKCDPEKAVELRQTYEAVQPGYHMSKIHWNTVHFNQDLNDKEILNLVDHSYQLVKASLPKKTRLELGL
ncbi:MAG: MmcQ/YjbR family DNA-binding protein [Bacteroidia bacterium]|nr:MmcQ/YjbR family DNA-binding protein [Bacteroidia bacterium]MCF8426765.1 MmcQ/YjbR family DNA-binding protein [Bacteroidia bacterium]MCF8445557.1 MmcQ/YjbR family DNA-binding protein [Bacteroidia bacterium]